MNDIALTAVTSIASGGVGAAVHWWTARKKTPAEVDNIIVNGAETTVQAALAVAAAESARADRAERQVLERDQRIAALEARLDALQQALDAAYEELHAIRSLRPE